MELPPAAELYQKFEAAVRERLRADGVDRPLVVGIHTGGAWLAKRLHRALDVPEPLGTLDISFYRDDFSTGSLHPQVRPSSLSGDIDGRTVLLVDDVLYSGRTVRAAMNELFDYGRPERVILAVLVDRGGRELPIAADICGLRLELPPGQHVKLRGPDPLQLELGAAC
ncbi:bifunctional pyr operon transcriptional regulator/uracil phosphoribosyltransferase PyrR [Methylonatrum kenyense]|uniref:bifunctional pyr operon transcriptional regulator/uracil phosphoribosyltransferase PyrR n=1 Tax=Methylonatrum kenyense TaxID=455253 RepID=UPI0020C15176|nr:bifunctional pyr operon transcriptional regulator/uracil phosphoribosyltransferase PyrR [Methylonatrum kenyense]MCK8516639.1 bifunctional pyr operon transcriptional regulator/uracil phosphoribosyltransferase PyrR [Methylonatrum kenyense]